MKTIEFLLSFLFSLTLISLTAIDTNPIDIHNPDGVKKSEWKISYSGDYEGEIGGSVVVVTGYEATFTVQTNSIRNGSLGLTLRKNGDVYNILRFNAALPDKIKCKVKYVKESKKFSVDLKTVSYDKNKVYIEFEGKLICDEKTINITGFIKKE